MIAVDADNIWEIRFNEHEFQFGMGDQSASIIAHTYLSKLLKHDPEPTAKLGSGSIFG